MKKSSSFLLASSAISCSLWLNACSFKKDSGVKAEDKAPQTVIVEKPSAEPVTALDALLEGNTESLDRHLAKMSLEQVNEYQKDGTTLLEVAVRQSNLDAVEKLLAKGALPLKPRKNAESTPLELAKKMNESITVALEQVVKNEKAAVVEKIKNKKYSEALSLLDSFYIKYGDSLVDNQSTLDLALNQEQKLHPELKTFVTKLLVANVPLESSKEKLLRVVVVDADLFQLSVSSLAKQKISLNSGFVFELIQLSSLGVMQSHLESLNANKFFAGQDLGKLQDEYLQKILSSLQPGQMVSLPDFQKILALLVPQSSERSFCSGCVSLALTHPALTAQRGEIIRLLVLNSNSAPAGFVKSLLGRLPLEDFRQIVGVLSPAIRKTQGDSFSGTWSLEEYQVLKDLGMGMTPGQALAQIKRLFALRFEGDIGAGEILAALKKDWRVARGGLSEQEEAILFTSEFLYSFNNELKQPDLLPILESIFVSDIKGLLVGEVNQEKLWMNPEHLFRFKDAQGMSLSFERLGIDFEKNTLRLLPKLGKDWFLMTDSWRITEHDLLWFEILDNDAAKLRLTPQLADKTVSGLWSKWAWRVGFNLENVRNRLDSSDKRYSTPSVEYRERYLPALLLSGPSQIKARLLAEMISGMLESDKLLERSAAGEFAVYLKSFSDASQRDVAFVTSFLPYLKKQNPRLRLALEGAQSSYMAFASGNFSQDPLCENSDTKEVFADHCKMIRNFNKELSPNKNNSAAQERDIGQILDNMKRESERKEQAIESLLKDDRISIKALIEISKITDLGPEMKSFFKENTWIFSVKFYEPSSLTLPNLKVPGT